jgi:hypothetical protein
MLMSSTHPTHDRFVLGGQFTLDDLRSSRFCLSPSGWGWGWRLSLAIVTQCVPVIIQPNVTQVISPPPRTISLCASI